MNIKKLFTLNLILLILLSMIFVPITRATVENETFELEDSISEFKPMNSPKERIAVNDVDGKEFYIKNACTGQYLDVSQGTAANGTNVQQYKYNGTVSQRWCIHYNTDGTATLFSRVGATDTYVYALDISGGSSENYANVQIYKYNGTDSQKFKIMAGTNDALVFYTKVSNYSKAVVLNGPSFNQGANIDQYTFQNHINEYWILEPVLKNSNLGVDYASANYNKYMYAYPNLTSLGGDCANFVSQCMLASGIHYQNNWYVYRKNENYSKPTTTSQLNNTWELSDPSPWISAKQFKKYWENQVDTYAYKASDIVANPSLAWNLKLYKGDVIQLADKTIFGNVGDASHTMYITGYTTTSGNSTYLLTYHSNETLNKSLLDICKSNSDSYLVFFKVM